MPVVKRGDHYQAQMRLAGYPSKSRTFTNKRAAEEWLAEQEVGLRKRQRAAAFATTGGFAEVTPENFTQLYRIFDSTGLLLYVGVSADTNARMRHHRACGKAWMDQVATVKVQTFETRDAALAAERRAIAKEAPVYNVQHRDQEGA